MSRCSLPRPRSVRPVCGGRHSRRSRCTARLELRPWVSPRSPVPTRTISSPRPSRSRVTLSLPLLLPLQPLLVVAWLANLAARSRSLLAAVWVGSLAVHSMQRHWVAVLVAAWLVNLAARWVACADNPVALMMPPLRPRLTKAFSIVPPRHLGLQPPLVPSLGSFRPPQEPPPRPPPLLWELRLPVPTRKQRRFRLLEQAQ